MTLYRVDGDLAVAEFGTLADHRVVNRGTRRRRAGDGQRPRTLSWRLKTIADTLGSLVLLVSFAPVFALIALAVKLSSPGPVLFRQPRYGAGTRVVVVTKFRTMRIEGTDLSGRRQATRNDDRVTRVGRFLRKTCLDELPQLWDVLRGRLSLVGPRPHALVLEVEGQPIEEMIPHYHERHRVRPGITGLAQINGNRGPVHNRAMAFERVRYDLAYIEEHSLLLDLKILLKTLVVPFQRNGSF